MLEIYFFTVENIKLSILQLYHEMLLNLSRLSPHINKQKGSMTSFAHYKSTDADIYKYKEGSIYIFLHSTLLTYHKIKYLDKKWDYDEK